MAYTNLFPVLACFHIFFKAAGLGWVNKFTAKWHVVCKLEQEVACHSLNQNLRGMCILRMNLALQWMCVYTKTFLSPFLPNFCPFRVPLVLIFPYFIQSCIGSFLVFNQAKSELSSQVRFTLFDSISQESWMEKGSSQLFCLRPEKLGSSPGTFWMPSRHSTLELCFLGKQSGWGWGRGRWARVVLCQSEDLSSHSAGGFLQFCL